MKNEIFGQEEHDFIEFIDSTVDRKITEALIRLPNGQMFNTAIYDYYYDVDDNCVVLIDRDDAYYRTSWENVLLISAK